MPSNNDFSFKILVGGSEIPEYTKDSQHFVECNLTTPVSYKLKSKEKHDGEQEIQAMPVTPYTVRVACHYISRPAYFRLLVDGIKVKGMSLDSGQSRLVKGFRDGIKVRELLFSMPRFPRGQHDRISEERVSSVGRIVVECWNAVIRRQRYGQKRMRLEFQQANKKDSSRVTDGHYMMATSRAGKVVSSRPMLRNVDHWKLLSMRSSLSVSYHMGHDLQEMGFTLKPALIKHRNKRHHDHHHGNKTTPSATVVCDHNVTHTAVKIEPNRPVIPSTSSDEPIIIDLTHSDEEDEGGSQNMGSVDVKPSLTDLSASACAEVKPEPQHQDADVRPNDDDDDDVLIVSGQKGTTPPVVDIDGIDHT